MSSDTDFEEVWAEESEGESVLSEEGKGRLEREGTSDSESTWSVLSNNWNERNASSASSWAEVSDVGSVHSFSEEAGFSSDSSENLWIVLPASSAKGVREKENRCWTKQQAREIQRRKRDELLFALDLNQDNTNLNLKLVEKIDMHKRMAFLEVQQRSVVHAKLPKSTFNIGEHSTSNQKQRFSQWRGAGTSVNESKKCFGNECKSYHHHKPSSKPNHSKK